MVLLILQELFVVKQQVPVRATEIRTDSTVSGKGTASSSPFTVQDILDAGLGDDGIITFEPLVLVLADKSGVMAAL